jgi:polyhydroxybutyrate depolymerase
MNTNPLPGIPPRQRSLELESSLERCASTAFVLAALVLHATLVHAGSADGAGHLDIDGRTRTYLLHAPPAYDGRSPIPLVIVLHGGGGTGTGAARQTGMSAKADRESFLAVYPEGTGPIRDRLLTWNAGNCCGYAMQRNVDDVAFMQAMLDRLQHEYVIDSKRVFVTGISNGAMIAYRLACEMSDRIAAGALNVDCPLTGPVSVMIVHGTADQNVVLEGGEPRKHFGPMRTDRSVAYAASFWADRDKCVRPPLHHQTGTLRTDVYTGCKDGTGVTVNIVENGGHAWPGGQRMNQALDEPSHEVSATNLIWTFFALHPKR